MSTVDWYNFWFNTLCSHYAFELELIEDEYGPHRFNKLQLMFIVNV